MDSTALSATAHYSAAPIYRRSWLDTVQVQRYDHLYDARPTATLTLGEALDAIRTGVYASEIRAVRAVLSRYGQDAYTQAKRALPMFTLCGVFAPTRAKCHLTQHAGIVHADVDHLGGETDLASLKLTLMLDQHVAYVFRSPSNTGLKFGIRIAPVTTASDYTYAWQVVCDAYQAQYGAPWDSSGKDVCRGCYASADPACFVNPDAVEFLVSPPAPAAPAPKVTVHAPYAGTSAERAAQRALAWAERLILASQPGQKHMARLRAAYLIGGFVGAGLMDYDQAYHTLEAAVRQTAQHLPRAMRTVKEGLQAGAARPLTATRPLPQMTTVPTKELSPWHV